MYEISAFYHLVLMYEFGISLSMPNAVIMIKYNHVSICRNAGVVSTKMLGRRTEE